MNERPVPGTVPYLEGVTLEELRRTLAEVEGKRATQRVMAGISYKDGVPQTTIAERHDVSRNTVRNWLERLERLEDEPVEEVLHDAPRPGRPPKLTDDQREQLCETLSRPPREAGVDATAWTPSVAQRYIADAYDVEYHVRHVRRILDDLERQ